MEARNKRSSTSPDANKLALLNIFRAYNAQFISFNADKGKVVPYLINEHSAWR